MDESLKLLTKSDLRKGFKIYLQNNDYSTNFKYKIIPVSDNTTNGIINLKIYNENWEQVTDLTTGKRLGFNVLIKG